MADQEVPDFFEEEEEEPLSLPNILSEELAEHQQSLLLFHGQDYIGLPQKTLIRLDRATLGLRGLMLLAAPPNVGKTALAVQLGLDVVRHNPDACFLFLSMEMPRRTIAWRMLCNLASLEWSTMVMGGRSASGKTLGGLDEEQQKRLEASRVILGEVGERIMVLDYENFPEPTVEKVIFELVRLKDRSHTSRAFILVDYLQVFPLPHGMSEDLGIHSEEEANRWRVEAMKAIRDLSGDAVLVISEMTRADPHGEWKPTMEDVVGSPRAVYTPDMVFLQKPLPEDLAAREFGGNLEHAKREMQRLGISFQRLEIAKGRDGVTRANIPLTFFYSQTRFAEGFRGFL